MDKNELEFGLHLGDTEKHLTICDMHKPLAFAPYLESLVIENPQISNTKYFYSACQLFDSLLKKNAPWAKFKIRTCEAGANVLRSIIAVKRAILFIDLEQNKIFKLGVAIFIPFYRICLLSLRTSYLWVYPLSVLFQAYLMICLAIS